MEDSTAVLNARIQALEYQRNLVLTEWAKDRANLAIASAAITEQDAKIASLEAQLIELTPKES